MCTGERHNNRIARDERQNTSSNVPNCIKQDLSLLLDSLGTRLATSATQPMSLVSALDLGDLPLAREVVAPPAVGEEGI
eukprot:jgi/Tetstr1/444250/TSEL_032143.t1